MYVTKPLPFWPFKEVDVDGIRPRQVQVYLLGSEMGDANLEIAKTILACWGKLLLFTSVPVFILTLLGVRHETVAFLAL